MATVLQDNVSLFRSRCSGTQVRPNRRHWPFPGPSQYALIIWMQPDVRAGQRRQSEVHNSLSFSSSSPFSLCLSLSKVIVPFHFSPVTLLVCDVKRHRWLHFSCSPQGLICLCSLVCTVDWLSRRCQFLPVCLPAETCSCLKVGSVNKTGAAPYPHLETLWMSVSLWLDVWYQVYQHPIFRYGIMAVSLHSTKWGSIHNSYSSQGFLCCHVSRSNSIYFFRCAP